MQFWIYLVLVLITDALAIILSKYYSLSQNKWYLVFAVLAFAFTGLFFCLSLNYKGMALANILWSAFASLLISFIGVTFFKEELATVQLVGIGVIVVGLALVNSK